MTAPNHGSRTPTPTVGSASRSSIGGLGKSSQQSPARELNEAFYGLVQVPTSSRALRCPPRLQAVGSAGNASAGRARSGCRGALLGVLPLALRPGLGLRAVDTPDTYARKEAAKSFNFQLISSIAFVLVAILGGITNLDIFGWLLPFMGLGWFILTIVGGAKALQGDDWRNPVKNVIKLEVLSEK